MRPSRRGLTLMELLVVAAVIGILALMTTPLVTRAQQEAVRQKCAGNLRQVFQTLDLVRERGKFPKCFELRPGATEVDEASWWYRVFARAAYPHTTQHDQLTVPRSYSAWWAANPHAGVLKFRPDQCPARCPASRDYYDDTYAPAYVPKCYEIDKDRVYDDNYGFNNFGFRYIPNVRTIHLPDGQDAIATSYLYHQPNAAGLGGRTPMEAIRGDRVVTDTTSYIGGPGEIADEAGTIVMMDYIKADAQPFPGVDGLYGYRFRHGGRANVLFLSGAVEAFHKEDFLRRVGSPGLHWEVRRRR